MFWILGGGVFEKVFRELQHAHPDGPSIWQILADQLEHVPWEGFHFEDLIFPLFVFVVGVSVALTVPRRVERFGRAGAASRALRRALILYVLGLLYYGGISHGLEGIRWVGVLQRIAIAYLFAACLFIWLRPRAIAWIAAFVLIGYWALLTFVPVPGNGAGNFAETKNLSDYIDSVYLPGKRWNRTHDPEGLLSTIPAITTCLLGLLAGVWILHVRPAAQKVGALVAAGAALLALGWFWGGNGPLHFPIIKNIWTSSFVLVTSGWSCMLLGLFYLVLDVWKIRRWAIPFVWIGLNPIALYLIEHLARASDLSILFAGGEIYSSLNRFAFHGAGALLQAIIATVISFTLAWYLHHRRVYLRV